MEIGDQAVFYLAQFANTPWSQSHISQGIKTIDSIKTTARLSHQASQGITGVDSTTCTFVTM